jgi:hypothetical protein
MKASTPLLEGRATHSANLNSELRQFLQNLKFQICNSSVQFSSMRPGRRLRWFPVSPKGFMQASKGDPSAINAHAHRKIPSAIKNIA